MCESLETSPTYSPPLALSWIKKMKEKNRSFFFFKMLQIGSQREIYKYILNFLLWMGRFLLNGLPISLIYRHLKAKRGSLCCSMIPFTQHILYNNISRISSTINQQRFTSLSQLIWLCFCFCFEQEFCLV